MSDPDVEYEPVRPSVEHGPGYEELPPPTDDEFFVPDDAVLNEDDD